MPECISLVKSRLSQISRKLRNFRFDSRYVLDFGAFSFVLDNSAFGTAFPVSVEFFDATDALLASYSIDQTVPGLAFTSGALNGVSKVVLPGGAFYDNFAVVPEPSAFLSVLGGMGILLGFRRRA